MINIIGNGPSLNTTDKNSLFQSDNVSVSFNRAYIVYQEYNFYPTYYFCIDKAVILNCLPDIKQLLDTPIQYFVLLDCQETQELAQHPKITLISKNNDNKLYFGDVATFSIYFLYSQKQLTQFEVYGCDCHYIEDYQQLNVEVKYNNNDPARKIVLKPKKGAKDPNHFIDNYFDETTEYSVPRTNNHLKCWENISELKEINIIFKTNSQAEKYFTLVKGSSY